MNTVLTAGRIPPVQVIAVSDSRTIIVDSHESHGPVVGQTRIAWWSPVDRKFRTFLVTDKSGSSGAWTLELDRRLVADDGTEVAAGDYISPAAVNSDAYGKSWVNAMRRLGPGENTEDPSRLPRSLRHPYIVDESPSSLSFATLELFQDAHSEITDLGYGYRSASSPSLPASSGDPPNILVPRNFGIYVLT
jgi:hypothetical protein